MKKSTKIYLIIGACLIGFAILARYFSIVGLTLMGTAAGFIFGYIMGRKSRK